MERGRQTTSGSVVEAFDNDITSCSTVTLTPSTNVIGNNRQIRITLSGNGSTSPQIDDITVSFSTIETTSETTISEDIRNPNTTEEIEEKEIVEPITEPTEEEKSSSMILITTIILSLFILFALGGKYIRKYR